MTMYLEIAYCWYADSINLYDRNLTIGYQYIFSVIHFYKRLLCAMHLSLGRSEFHLLML